MAAEYPPNQLAPSLLFVSRNPDTHIVELQRKGNVRPLAREIESVRVVAGDYSSLAHLLT
jgi:hypothetical protein